MENNEKQVMYQVMYRWLKITFSLRTPNILNIPDCWQEIPVPNREMEHAYAKDAWSPYTYTVSTYDLSRKDLFLTSFINSATEVSETG